MDLVKNSKEDTDISAKISGSTDDSLQNEKMMIGQQQSKNQLLQNQFMLPQQEPVNQSLDYQNLQLNYLMQQQQQYQKLITNQQQQLQNNNISNNSPQQSQQLIQQTQLQNQKNQQLVQQSQKQQIMSNQVQQNQQQLFQHQQQNQNQNQNLNQEQNDFQINQQQQQNSITNKFVQGNQLNGCDHYQFLANPIGSNNFVQGNNSNINYISNYGVLNQDQSKMNIFGSNNGQINYVNGSLQQNYLKNLYSNNNFIGHDIGRQQMQQLNENQLAQLQNQIKMFQQGQNSVLENVINQQHGGFIQQNLFKNNQLPQNLFNSSNYNLMNMNMNMNKNNIIMQQNSVSNGENNKHQNNIQNFRSLPLKDAGISVKKEIDNQEHSGNQNLLNLESTQQQDIKKKIDLKLTDLHMKADDKIDTQIWKKQIKPHTGHVPTNFMNILIPYLLKVWRNKIPCKKGKQEKQENACDCKPCQEFTLLRGMKRNKRNVSIVAFKKLWSNKRIAVVSLDFLNHYSLNGILDKVGYRNPCTKISILLCLKNFHAAVMKPETFYKLLP